MGEKNTQSTTTNNYQPPTTMHHPPHHQQQQTSSSRVVWFEDGILELGLGLGLGLGLEFGMDWVYLEYVNNDSLHDSYVCRIETTNKDVIWWLKYEFFSIQSDPIQSNPSQSNRSFIRSLRNSTKSGKVIKAGYSGTLDPLATGVLGELMVWREWILIGIWIGLKESWNGLGLEWIDWWVCLW